MIHNGIEYGMLQAYAEGYEILHASKDFKLDLHQISAVWNRGSVVRSWLNELAERAFAKDADLTALKGYVEDSGEGRWTVQEAIDLDVPAPVITLSLLARFRSRQSRLLRRQGHRGAPQRVRRPRGEDHMTARASLTGRRLPEVRRRPRSTCSGQRSRAPSSSSAPAISCTAS